MPLTLRSSARWLARTTATLLTALVLFILLAWGLGRLLTDRYLWSQYLFWIPAVGVIFAAAAGLLAAHGLARAGRRDGHKPPRFGRRLRLLGWAGVAAAVAVFLLIDLRVQGYVLRPAPAAPGTTIRILAWNPSAPEMPWFSDIVAARRPDVALITNPPAGVSWTKLAQSFGPAAPIARSGPLMILSRFPVLRFGGTTLGIPDAQVHSPVRAGHLWAVLDPGHAMYAELDTTAVLGRTTVVWLIDLPSDPHRLKSEFTEDAAATIRAWSGTEFVPTESGGQSPFDRADAVGFPAPDLIAGDCNIPRGSASLRVIVGGMRHAFSEAGAGYSASWPRRWPVFHIDQTFLGPRLRATSYRIVDPGAGGHRMQLIDATGAARP
jgi:hypothetical protein